MNKCMKQKKSANDSYAVQEINTHQLKMHLADREYSPAQTDMCWREERRSERWEEWEESAGPHCTNAGSIKPDWDH